MFTLPQIKDAHSKVKSGADFPRYVQDLIKLGVLGYETFVGDGHTEYFGAANCRLQGEPRYAPINVAATGNTEKFKSDLKNHQQGGSDFPTFCAQAAEAGVFKWIVDTRKMSCTYYDREGNEMLAKTIPTA